MRYAPPAFSTTARGAVHGIEMRMSMSVRRPKCKMFIPVDKLKSHFTQLFISTPHRRTLGTGLHSSRESRQQGAERIVRGVKRRVCARRIAARSPIY